MHVSASLASCGQMEDEAWGNGRCDAMENAEVREGTMFLDVRLSVGDGGPSKRGNLAGGEDGDGREPGNDDEKRGDGAYGYSCSPTRRI